VGEMENESKAELRGRDLRLDNRVYMLSPASTANGASILNPGCLSDAEPMKKHFRNEKNLSAALASTALLSCNQAPAGRRLSINPDHF